MISSILFKNSGLNRRFTSSMTPVLHTVIVWPFHRSATVKPRRLGATMFSAPALEVMMKMVFLKSILRPWAVGDMAVVQHLEQDVEHIRVGLFNLVKKDHRIGIPAAPFR